MSLLDGSTSAGAPLAMLGLSWFLQSMLVIGVGLATARLLRGKGAAVESTVLRATLLGVVLLPLAAVLLAALGVRGFGSELAAVMAPRAAPAAVSPALSPSAAAAPVRGAPGTAAPTPAELVTGGPALGSRGDGADAAPAPASWPELWPELSLSFTIAAVWSLGAAGLLARLAFGIAGAAAVRRRGRPADRATLARCRALAGGGAVAPAGAPAVLVSDEVESPCLVGVLRPAILLPRGGATVEDAVLLHELWHWRRHDPAWNLLRSVCSAILFFQPLVWLLSRRMELVAEDSCDDVVVHLGHDRSGYAESLLAVAERQHRHWHAAAAVSVVPLRSALARRIGRILDRTCAPPVRTGARRAAVVAISTALVTLISGLIGARGQDPARPAITGRVLDAKGAPVAGATLHLVAAGNPYPVPKPVRVTKTDAHGDFAFELEKQPLAKLSIAAGAAGSGFAFAEIEPADAARPLALALSVDLAVRGRILDADARPVAGVDVRVADVRTPANGDLVAYAHGRVVAKSNIWYGAVPSLPEHARSDADGRFEIMGLGAGRVVRLWLDGPRISCAGIQVLTRAAAGEENPLKSPVGTTHYFAEFEHVSAPARAVRGTVRDRATGKPVPGVVVKGLRALPPYEVATAGDGRFEVRGCAKRSKYRIDFVPKQSLHFAVQETFDDTNGIVPLEVAVELDLGIVARGTVTDAASGKPIHGQIGYYPLVANAMATRRTYAELPIGSDGTYAIPVLPGPGVLGVRILDADVGRPYPASSSSQHAIERQAGLEPRDTGAKMGSLAAQALMVSGGGVSFQFLTIPDYKVLAGIRPEEGAEGLAHDFRLERGRRLAGRVVGPDGKPIGGVRVSGLEPGSQFDSRVLEDAAFTVEAMAPGGSRQVVFTKGEQNLAAVVDIRADDQANDQKDQPLTVALAPCGALVAVLLDDAGAPLVSAAVQVGGNQFPRIGKKLAQTDRQGRVEVLGLVPGATYEASVVGAATFARVVVVAGKTTDLGNLTLRPEQLRAMVPK